ncbi:MAG: methyltransferase domain-containing protein [Candidatus Diapherotrites archaeon]
MTYLSQNEILQKYRKEKLLWGLTPNKYLAEIPKIVKSGDVLDFGVGEGRNALFLAKKGFSVTGIDISKAAVKKFLMFAKKRNLHVKGIVGDIANFKFNRNYDVIICIAVLDLISNPLKLIKKMKKHTNKGGLNLVSVFTTKNTEWKKYPGLYFFKETELKEIYKDWQIIKYENYIKKDRHGKPHKHHIAILIAKK